MDLRLNSLLDQLKFNFVIDKNYFNSILIIKINIRNIKELETKGFGLIY